MGYDGILPKSTLGVLSSASPLLQIRSLLRTQAPVAMGPLKVKHPELDG